MKTTRNFKVIIMAFLAMLCLQSCPDAKVPDDDYKKPTGLLSFKEANDKEEVYKEYIHKIANKVLAKQNQPAKINREIWFDLENLENYIKYVKKQSKKEGYKNLGLRVYLGATKEDTIKSTVFFVPTHRKEIEGAKSFASLRNENSLSIQSLNYGSAGKPPKEL